MGRAWSGPWRLWTRRSRRSPQGLTMVTRLDVRAQERDCSGISSVFLSEINIRRDRRCRTSFLSLICQRRWVQLSCGASRLEGMMSRKLACDLLGLWREVREGDGFECRSRKRPEHLSGPECETDAARRPACGKKPTCRLSRSPKEGIDQVL